MRSGLVVVLTHTHTHTQNGREGIKLECSPSLSEGEIKHNQKNKRAIVAFGGRDGIWED